MDNYNILVLTSNTVAAAIIIRFPFLSHPLIIFLSATPLHTLALFHPFSPSAFSPNHLLHASLPSTPHPCLLLLPPALSPSLLPSLPPSLPPSPQPFYSPHSSFLTISLLLFLLPTIIHICLT